MKAIITQFRILVFLIACVLTLPILVQQGMFLDGVLYAAVSNNMATGYGTFWEPRFSTVGIARSPIMLEHPPLIFGIQSLFFRVFGSGFLTERIYSFFTLLVTMGLFAGLWKDLSHKIRGIAQMEWFALFIWITLPLTYWIYQNNMQENTMGIFTLCAGWFSLKYLLAEKKNVIWLIATGVSIFLASYSKGVPGLFVFSILPLHFLVFRDMSFGDYLKAFAIVLLSFAVCYALIFAWEPSRTHMMQYLELRLFERISAAPTVDHRFRIVFRIFWELIYHVLFSFALLFVFRKRRLQYDWFGDQKKWILFFFLIGLSGSLPVALTLVQKGFYITPSFPFFAIAVALISAAGLKSWLEGRKLKRATRNIVLGINVSLLATIVVVCSSLFGNYSRNEEMMKAGDALATRFEGRTTLRIQRKMWNEWKLQAHMQRFHAISFTYADSTLPFFVSWNEEEPGYELVEKYPIFYLHEKAEE